MWNPNVLNWPSYIHKKLGDAICDIVKKRHEQNQLPSEFHKYIGISAKSIPTVRSICMARENWCIVEADYQTAEMRGLAFISGDEQLKKIILEPDDCFAKPKKEFIPAGIDPDDCVVRLKFPEYVQRPVDKEKFILTYTEDNVVKATFTMEQLERDEDGNIVHTRFDTHWQVGEMARKTAREVMNKKIDRGASKAANFASAYGAGAKSIAIKIEADTGIRPTDEEANSFLVAICERQPRATMWFAEMESLPERGMYYRAASGRIRHCHLLRNTEEGYEKRTRESQIQALKREFRNFP